jgi:phage terminase large subunit GpA-like protein
VTGFGWSSAERRAWKPRKRLKPSEWAETHRELPRGQSSRPGRWKNENAAYLRGIMDIADRPGVAEVNIMKAAQVGGSEAIRNLMGCWSDQDPEPMGIALPSREKGRKIVDNRIIPLYADTKVLKSKLTGDPRDVQKGQVKLVDHIIFLMWAGSPTAMSSDPMCRAVCDEVDKFEDWAGKEADPVSLVKKRLVTYEDRAKLINISTPTTRFGRIAELFEASTIKLYFYVPCPALWPLSAIAFSTSQVAEDSPTIRKDAGGAYRIRTTCVV